VRQSEAVLKRFKSVGKSGDKRWRKKIGCDPLLWFRSLRDDSGEGDHYPAVGESCLNETACVSRTTRSSQTKKTPPPLCANLARREAAFCLMLTR